MDHPATPPQRERHRPSTQRGAKSTRSKGATPPSRDATPQNPGVFYTDNEFKQVKLIQVMSGEQEGFLKKNQQA
ncbi:hypothetical protein CRENBAI_014111 [Crenichthys baileyi]|uniref:Uncharacterized protein n=1 Tax=Crenichthys baileyi TaxID=28760 RepID=A0AAV9RJL9_9TELE